MGFIATNIDKICGKCNVFNPKCCTNEKLGLSLHSLTKTARTGAVVQLVRIHACHAWGRGFESRPHRRNPETKVSGFFVFRTPQPSNIRFCGNLQKSAEQPSKQRDAPPGKSTTWTRIQLTPDRVRGIWTYRQKEKSPSIRRALFLSCFNEATFTNLT